MWMYNAADLPKMSDKSFVLWINKQLLTSEDSHSSISTSFTHSPNISKADIIEIVWCLAQPLSQPESLVSSCAILTSSTIFIEKLVAKESTFPGMPELEPFYILPMKNIQQLVIGPCNSFLRLEEAFVGKSGTFTLYCLEPLGIQRLIQKLISLCQNLNHASDLDIKDLNTDSDLLKSIASHEEEMTGFASDRLVLMIPIRLCENPQFHFLLLSENSVYCIDLKCALWPPPSFESLPESSLNFNIFHEFSVTDKLVDLKIHPDTEKERISYAKTLDVESKTVPIVDFAVCQLSLIVETGHEKFTGSVKTQIFKYFFPCPAFRDQFLDRLSNLRAEQANRMSPNVREEPEGGNEQLSDSGSVDNKMKFNKNNSNSSTVGKISHSSNESKDLEDDKIMKPIPCVQADRSEEVLSPVAESFRSFHSSSNESFQSILESEGMSQAPSLDYLSASPKEDLPPFPTSNFSRVSISPPVKKAECEKHPETVTQNTSGEKQVQAIQYNFNPNSTSKADSLPSSFDWKKFYFTDPPSTVEEHPDTSMNQPASAKGETFREDSSNLLGSTARAGDHAPLRLNIGASQASSYIPGSESASQNETELDRYLRNCVSSFDLIFSLSTKMKPLRLMNGGELRKFFHDAIAQHTHLDVTEGLTEELHYVLWAIVIPYTNPKQEITTLVMLSTYAIYLVSDIGVKVSQTSRPSWMTHSRNQSDSAVTWKTAKESFSNRKVVKPYLVLKYKDLHQIHIGLFDQCVRLTGYNENAVFTIATKDSQVTETLIEKFKQVLSLSVSSPMLERSHQELEQDFYRDVTKRTMSTVEGLVYTHPSQVNFVYPGDDAIRDVLYLIRERASSGIGSNLSDKTSSLWLYIQCYRLPSEDSSSSCTTTQPRTILITSSHFSVAEEDIVTYPLPDFVRGLPENPCHEILDCRAIDSLKRIHLYHSNPHWVNLTFIEEQPDIVVDVNMQHFAQSTAGREKQKVAPEFNVKLFIQSLKERDKLVQILEKLWKQHVSQVGRILDIQKI